MQLIKKRRQHINRRNPKKRQPVYEQRITHPIYIREEYRNGIGTVVIFQEADGEFTEIVINPHPHYQNCSRLIDALFERNQQEIQRSKKVYKHVVLDTENLIRYVA